MRQFYVSRLVNKLLLFGLLAFAQTAFAQATLSIQGIIQKSNGAAVEDGKYDLTFKLYATPSGGTAVHTETQNIAVAGGIYSAELGSGSTPLTAAFDQTYYLGVSVDGGTELIPRARLTSSPYSLALLGTSNLFPSSGAIGAGTITPASGFQIHARNGSGTGKMLVSGTEGATMNFEREGAASAQMGLNTSNNGLFINSSSNTALMYQGTTKLLVTNDGIRVPAIYTSAGAGHLPLFVDATERLRVHGGGAHIYGEGLVTGNLTVGGSPDGNVRLKVDGKTQLIGLVQIEGTPVSLGSSTNAVHGNTNNFFTGTGAAPFLLNVSNRIRAQEFWAYSDRRIKKDFHLSDNLADLTTLRKLRVTDYRHIETMTKGDALKKGFIAQEVKESFPEAVTIVPDFIPNVYAFSTQTKLSSGKMIISLDKNHEFAVGDEVKLVFEESGEKRTTVTAVASENTFSIDWDGTAVTEKVFVFGKKVSDFQSVDYDRIFTLNVSATQELAREMEEMKKTVARYEQENAALKAALEKKDGEMKASAEKFDARLRALENKLSN